MIDFDILAENNQLKELDVKSVNSDVNISNVLTMRDIIMDYSFDYCSMSETQYYSLIELYNTYKVPLIKIQSYKDMGAIVSNILLFTKDINANIFDVSKLNSYYKLFDREYIKNFFNLETIDISDWSFNNVENTVFMFRGLLQLKQIKGIEDINLFSINKMFAMFSDCEELKVNFNKWDISNKTDYKMFDYMCYKCKSLDKGSFDSWGDKIKFKYKPKHMFYGCENIPQWYEKLENEIK